MEQSIKKKVDVLFLLKLLAFSYILTAVFLLILSMLLYKFRLSETIINIGIVVIYIAATFFTGFLAGKKIGTKKYLWGLFLGAGYFLILTLISLIINHGISDFSGNFLSTLFLCVGSGMLGGMLS
ncbi:MAG: TIGR04086 family membrane protein [Roseburia sp.]|nr:TIGR04086 family membrane protein [Roseburia sp.]MCM1279682.1 TIGR04086 family membrane protein [Robinsoniella sp.]